MSVKNAQQLKQLNTRAAKLEVDIKEARLEAKDKQQYCSRLENQLSNVKKEIVKLEDSEIVVSEHAMLRYIERVMGVDLEAIQQRILTPAVTSLINNAGSGKFPIEGGGKVVVKGNTIVSVV